MGAGGGRLDFKYPALGTKLTFKSTQIFDKHYIKSQLPEGGERKIG